MKSPKKMKIVAGKEMKIVGDRETKEGEFIRDLYLCCHCFLSS